MKEDSCLVRRDWEIFLSHLKTAGTNTKSKAFGSKILAIASFAIDLAFSFAQVGRIHSFVAQKASKTALVPGFSRSTHQFSNEHLKKKKKIKICEKVAKITNQIEKKSSKIHRFKMGKNSSKFQKNSKWKNRQNYLKIVKKS